MLCIFPESCRRVEVSRCHRHDRQRSTMTGSSRQQHSHGLEKR
ncbi:hypothetical protein MINT15_06930 [Saccharomonospora viridis]|uniref:Uncharacterized protein n=1 Tax=Saccharomonospora viridis TaxID=1852 RepID=A0A837DHW8_9PSEU|nr:hypothetical protein MINT15_06930 [Saccharomonospora viridis]